MVCTCTLRPAREGQGPGERRSSLPTHNTTEGGRKVVGGVPANPTDISPAWEKGNEGGRQIMWDKKGR